MHVRDYIAANHEFAYQDSRLHAVEFWFECRLLTEPDPERMTEPDVRQETVEWVPLERLPELRFYPQSLIPLLTGEDNAPLYLGDVN
jgi:hypothetical protein